MTNAMDHEEGDSIESIALLAWKTTTTAINHEKGDSVESERGKYLLL